MLWESDDKYKMKSWKWIKCKLVNGEYAKKDKWKWIKCIMIKRLIDKVIVYFDYAVRKKVMINMSE